MYCRVKLMALSREGARAFLSGESTHARAFSALLYSVMPTRLGALPSTEMSLPFMTRSGEIGRAQPFGQPVMLRIPEQSLEAIAVKDTSVGPSIKTR